MRKAGGRSSIRFVAVVVACFIAANADAHKPSDSYLTLQVRSNELTGRWDLALRDVPAIVRRLGDLHAEAAALLRPVEQVEDALDLVGAQPAQHLAAVGVVGVAAAHAAPPSPGDPAPTRPRSRA